MYVGYVYYLYKDDKNHENENDNAKNTESSDNINENNNDTKYDGDARSCIIKMMIIITIVIIITIIMIIIIVVTIIMIIRVIQAVTWLYPQVSWVGRKQPTFPKGHVNSLTIPKRSRSKNCQGGMEFLFVVQKMKT